MFSSSFFKAEKDNGNIELENKKLEKESKNEQERESGHCFSVSLSDFSLLSDSVS